MSNSSDCDGRTRETDGRCLLWLNGPFGIGKTSVAKLVAEQLGAPIFDPETVGFMLREILGPALGANDFQDVLLWRTAVAHIATGLVSHVDGVVVMPMTVYRPNYRGELRASIADVVPVLEVVLVSTEDELRRRVSQRDLGPSVQAWCELHATPALRSYEREREGDQVVDTTDLRPAEVAERVVAIYRSSGSRP